MTIIIQREAGNRLSQHEWRFYVNADNNIAASLRGYVYSERETTRHKFRPVRHYDRIDRRTANIAVEDIPLPTTVEDELKKIIINCITINK